MLDEFYLLQSDGDTETELVVFVVGLFFVEFPFGWRGCLAFAVLRFVGFARFRPLLVVFLKSGICAAHRHLVADSGVDDDHLVISGTKAKAILNGNLGLNERRACEAYIYTATATRQRLEDGIQVQLTHLASNFQVDKHRPVETSQHLTVLSLLADNNHWPV